MSRLLLDSGSILKLFSLKGSEALQITEPSCILPLTWYEIGNAFRTDAFVRRSMTQDKAEAMLLLISNVMVAVEILPQEPRCNVEVLKLAGQYSLSFYDASYLYSASRWGLILVTEEAGLKRAAVEAGVEVRSVVDL